jgi:hypothetical protein
MQREVRNVIFTDHAIERLQQRRITQPMVVSTIQSPDRKQLEDDGDTKFIKTIDGRNLHVVGHWESDENKWLVKSAWVRGEDDVKPSLLKMLFDLALKLVRSIVAKRR